MAKAAFTMEQAQVLRQEYEAGKNTVELARAHNVSDTCIVTWIKRAGGTIRTNSESKRKSTFNEKFWDNINDELRAYWLGFFMADGYIGQYLNKWRNFWCTVSAKDGHHLDQFLKDIQATYEVNYFDRKGEDGKVYKKAQICLTSIPFVESLIQKGWLDFKKNGDLRLGQLVPPELHHHFVRGFFDGDGSIGKQHRKDKKILSHSYSITIVAPQEHQAFLEWVRDLICSATGARVKPLKRGKAKQTKTGEPGRPVWRCHWNGNRQVRSIGHWMYNNATRMLERKKLRFDAIDHPVRFNWPADNRFDCSHTPAQIAALPPTERQRVIDHFYRLVMNSVWVAPRYSDKQLLGDFRAAMLYDSDLYLVKDDSGQLAGFRLNTGGNAESPGKRIVLHFHPHFWDVRTAGPTIPSKWHNPSIVKRATAALLTTGSRISLARYLREMRYAGTGVTSHFHPNFAIAIVQALAPEAKSWFDPCMGWGGRLMASKIMELDYEGCDPQPTTFRGLAQIRDFIGSTAILNNVKAQDYSFSRQFDLGFTSPPFFNKERYGQDEQSYIEFPQYSQWVTEFMCPLVDKLKANCRKVVLHVDDRIADSLEKIYPLKRYPLFLQRNPGSKKGTEAVLVFQ
jgi:hypothetical protein